MYLATKQHLRGMIHADKESILNNTLFPLFCIQILYSREESLRTTEYSELKGTLKDQQVQLLNEYLI